MKPGLPAPAPAVKPAAPAPAALIDIAQTLTALLERETNLVRNLQIGTIGPLQEEKLRLTRAFQSGLKALGPPETAFAGGLRLRWLEVGRRLSAAALDNERALRVGRVATERLIGAVVSAVKQSRKPVAGYTARRVAPRQRSVAGIALDHRL